MAALEVFRAANSNSTRRCALVMGWTGGSLRHVAKHSSALWSNNLHVNSVATTITLQEAFLPREETGLRDKVRELLDVATCQLQAKEVVVHCFSNGGCLLFLTLLEELHERRCRLLQSDDADSCSVGVPSIVGTIYDSCPIPSVHPVRGPFLTMFATPFPWREKLWILRDLVPYAMTSTLIQPVKGNPIGWYSGLRDPAFNSPSRPELVLYSAGDKLTPASAVEDFARLRESQGARVTRHLFPDDSPHVQHYRTRPQEYEEVVSTWLAKEVQWTK